MPISYQFISRATGQAVDLDEVDRDLCIISGDDYSESSYCSLFLLARDTLTWIEDGDWPLSNFRFDLINDGSEDWVDWLDYVVLMYRFQAWRVPSYR